MSFLLIVQYDALILLGSFPYQSRSTVRGPGHNLRSSQAITTVAARVESCLG